MNGKNYTVSGKEQSNTYLKKEGNQSCDRKEERQKEKINRKKGTLDQNASSDYLCSQKITARVFGHKRRKENTVDFSLKEPKMLSGPTYRDRETIIFHKQLNESDVGKYSYFNFEPASSIGYSQDEPLDLSFTPSVDPLTIHDPTIKERKNIPSILIDNALAFSRPSHFICDDCKVVFEYKDDLKSHICKFTREKSNELIGSTFSKRHEPKRRRKEQTRKKAEKCDEGLETQALESAPIPKITHTNEQPLCDICGNTFSSSDDLLTHKKSCAVSSKDKQHTCDNCDKRFKYKKTLSVHSLKHIDEKINKCDKCNKTFSTKKYLEHAKRCGTTDKKYECKECHKKYRHKKSLDIHYRKHTGEQPFECVECGKRFSNPSHFNRHKKGCGCSPEDRPYACDKCNKKFTRKEYLVNHSLIHSGVKRYQCETCLNSYFTKDALKKHEKRRGCSLQSKQ